MRALDRIRSRPVAQHEQRWTVDQYLEAIAQGLITTSPQTTYGISPQEPIRDDFVSYVTYGLFGCSVVATVEQVRASVFSEARFMWQQLAGGRPGKMFGDRTLSVLETPWPQGSTGGLLSRMILDADLAGNAYIVRQGDRLVRLRPDWVNIALVPILDLSGSRIGWERVGYTYRDNGTGEAAAFLPEEVAHFAPMPDPLATYRGMSWLTPVVREIQGDVAATAHKLKFFEHGATPNLVVSLPKETTQEQYDILEAKIKSKHAGSNNAYKTMLLTGGADVTVVGIDLGTLDFKSIQGAGETRIANAAGVPAVIAGLSEGLAGSSLNAGNYSSAKRRFADGTMRPLWRELCASLSTIVPPPAGCRLWWDGRDIAFLRDDEKDLAEIMSLRATTIRQLVEAGYEPESVALAIDTEDLSVLKHTGMFSVQLQLPGGAA